MNCKHHWKIFAMSNVHLTKCCAKCNEQNGRNLTPAERFLWKQSWNEDIQDIENLHKVSNAFFKQFKRDNEWKYTGYDLISRVKRWVKKYPTVSICSCDDDYFMSSIIVLIPHENSREYMGHTMICIPQNGKPPCEMFLYPGHTTDLLGVLKQIGRKPRKTPRGIFQKIRP